MDQQASEQAFMSTLVTEHFAQQSTASATISESSSRASLYLLSLSSSLIALGFATQSRQTFPYFAAAIRWSSRSDIRSGVLRRSSPAEARARLEIAPRRRPPSHIEGREDRC
jgi:hypothetical protein